ncbi:Fungal specific transcription factor, putative [Coccidioides posadasii C735 delta SOWgp]|uniref:Fungal specific transcription factor, putative n=1 Tax=Coccidioides posadasii (strain C735) TaxID=222929 RepID=C5P093_COCP7|nr:Fungal specific transcription factor, putative [Coccidioides posadasii C735 delta SOWgp]EER29738.1 Fungal specific transcription factor, putative [Coccidioides posadasii C735 delta SOWgp]|eukprot:XP_003071883.1 Fungal specific transcription factor, putative [Coccidioides posadasii C735 delta SOWgp]
MAPTPPSVTSSNASTHSPHGRVVRRRNRVPLSCAPCRNRKLKCNRAVPCENCVKRGDALSCTYAQPNARRRNHGSQLQLGTPDDMQSRIDRLESLVLSLMRNGSQSTGAAPVREGRSGDPGFSSLHDRHSSGLSGDDREATARDEESDTEQVTKSFGIMKVDAQNQKSYYVSEAHWTSILNDIVEVKNFWSTHKKQIEEQMEKLLVISIPTIRMVFAMMRLAVLSYHRDEDEPPEFREKSLDIARSYQSSMAQCLILADYTKPHRYVLEALVLHLQGEYSQTSDAQVSLWVLVGIIVRLAMRMGYHRDASMFPNISVFQGEMRRRLWSFIRCADLLFSFQVGLPSMVRSGDSDTDIPRSLHDDDFDENSTALPPGRPFNEPTPVSYLVAKTRLAFVFGRVLEHSQKVKGSTYEEVMEIDKALRQARELVPEHLHVQPISECDKDPAYLIMSRFGIMSIYHKAQCVLHRPFLNHARENPRYIYSRRTCIDSSMELLRFQLMLHGASRPNGKLRHRTWYSSSFSSHDFLMASTIIALDLYHDYRSHSSEPLYNTAYSKDVQRQEEMLAALRRSRDIWDELKDKSIDAWKAAVVLGMLLEQLNQSSKCSETSHSEQVLDAQDEKQTAAMTLGLLSSGITPLGPTSPPHVCENMGKIDPNIQQHLQRNSIESIDHGPPHTSATPFGIFGHMPDMQSFNLDWEAWDTYIQSTAFDATTEARTSSDPQQLQQSQFTIGSLRTENGPNPTPRRTYPNSPGFFESLEAGSFGGGMDMTPEADVPRYNPGQP